MINTEKMKYKVGDKTLLGKITVVDKEDKSFPYQINLERNRPEAWFTESPINLRELLAAQEE